MTKYYKNGCFLEFFGNHWATVYYSMNYLCLDTTVATSQQNNGANREHNRYKKNYKLEAISYVFQYITGRVVRMQPDIVLLSLYCSVLN